MTDATPPSPSTSRTKADHAALEEARDALSTATGGRPDFEGFVEALHSEARWIVQLYRDKPKELQWAQRTAQELNALAAEVEKTGRRVGML